MLRLSVARLQELMLSFSWQSVIWSVNGFFLLMTVMVSYLPDSGSSFRRGAVQYLAQFSLANEKTLATYWEGWCLLLVSILAFEQFLRSDKTSISERQTWIGLSVLAAGLSLDELGSIHERSPWLFSSWGLSGSMITNIPLAVPALLILIFTLRGMWRLADRRPFRLTLSAFIVLGSVAFQEHIEHAYVWPWWARGIRFGIEEGTELLGAFLLLCAVVSATGKSGKLKSIACLAPGIETLVRLRPVVVFLTLVGFIPLGIFTSLASEDATFRGIPAAWLPFMSLNLASMAAWACAQRGERYRNRLLVASLLALFFSLDQILVFERVLDKNLIRGMTANLMFPCLAAICLVLPTLRTRSNGLLLGAMLPLSLLLTLQSELLPWLVMPVQSLGIFWVLTSGLVAAREAAPAGLRTAVT